MDNSAGRYGGRSPRKQPPLTAVASTAAVAGTAAFLALLVLGALPAQRDTNHTGNPPHLTVKSSTPNVSALAADAGRGTRRGRAGSDGEPTGIPGTAGNPTGPAAGACDDWAPIRDFNAETVNGPVQALVKRPFFRYYRVQLENECPCWTDNDGMCMTEDCEVTECDEPRLRNSLLATTPFNQVRQGQCEPQPPLEGLHPRGAACPTEVSIDLAPARTLTGTDPGEEYPEAIVCLPDNPERFTGYSGRSAHRVWGGVQAECDALGGTAASPALHDAMERLMSGFHASVSTHLCRLWPDEETGDFHPNADEFWRRFSADATGGCGPRWLGNLHFLFRTVLEAVARAQPVWERYPFASSDPAADDETRRMAAQLSASARRYIEGRSAAAGGEEQGGWPLTALLQTEGADSFMQCYGNIREKMDCVGCTKCRLWGKLQVHAIGVALNILRAETRGGGGPAVDLGQNDVVALFNLLERLSKSVAYIQEFERAGPSGDGGGAARRFVQLPDDIEPSGHPPGLKDLRDAFVEDVFSVLPSE